MATGAMHLLTAVCLLYWRETAAHHFHPSVTSRPSDTAQRIRALGYPAETHNIVTEDGYILTSFRIPHGKNSSLVNPKPLIIQHGVLCSSDCWVFAEKTDALSFVLADAGYDVWLTNSRGNSYSRSHINYTTKDAQFWNFSFHEMGYYDLPATIDYILNVTHQDKLVYIGHSQGTAIYFVMASTRPDYNKKVKVMGAMAPVAFLNNTKGAIRSLGRISDWLIDAAHLLNLKYVLDHSVVISVADHILCSLNLDICNELLSFVVGFDSVHLNKGILPYIADICPTGASVKQLIHFSQLVRNDGKFTWYDYGVNNKLIYNSTKPPEYNLSAITSPILLYYGPNDYISSVSEVKQIYSKLQKVPDIKEISTYNHLDFMWGKDAKDLIYNHIIDVLKNY